MLVRLLLTAVLAAGFAAAQIGGDEGGMGGGGGRGGGRGGGSGGEMGGGMPQARRLSKTEMLFDKLKLNKEQKEEAATIISAAMEKAAPTRDLLNKGRMIIANTITGKGSEDEIKKLFGEYVSVSADMTRIEAEAFSKLYALLKPNQQSKAPQAFELMAGMFAGGGMPGGGQGRGRGRQ
jgi:Spy/CpxP family protein refolding chaperone